MAKPFLRFWRHAIVLVAIAAFASYILVRFATLASMGPIPSAQKRAERVRGEILDREGRPLAVETSLYNIAVWRPEVDRQKLPEDAAFLADLLSEGAGGEGETAVEMVSRIESSRNDFLYLVKRVQASAARRIQDERRSGGLKGFIIERVPGRIYPEKSLASHLIGFIGDDGHGLVGIEEKFDGDLSPPPEPGASGEIRGNSVVLTIDADVQYQAEAIARKTREENKAEAVILIVSAVDSGEIIAYAAMPDFDPNDFLSYPETRYADLPATYMYEPGSVMKIFTMASVLDLGAIDMHTAFTCDGTYERTTGAGEKIVIKDSGVHGRVDLTRILMYSCNAGASYASDLVPGLDFYDKLRRFGFGSRTGITLPGESPGRLARVEDWSSRTKPTIAFGQEISVTALQVVQAASAIGNGGVRMKPLVARRVTAPDGTVLREDAPLGTKVVSPETARDILAAMEAASLEGGSGWRARIPDFRISVKTGTAQMVESGRRGYSSEDFIASCIAIFPTDAPSFVVYVAVIKPRGESIQGGKIAAPPVRETAEMVIEHFGLARGTATTVRHPGTVAVPDTGPVEIGSVMPDLTGVPKRRLLPLLSRKDIIVLIEGDGYVAEQSPKPGEPVTPGATVRLVLR
ncbi:MAG: penicillin-binding protein [Spirochaetes bacterium]|nr:penicillin-binding protein [Spirochaetota bacterium]